MNVHRIYGLVLRRFRPRRMRAFATRYQITASTRILDVGGSAYNWSFLPIQPQLTILNIFPGEAMGADWLVADGCRIPFADNTFDIVFTNSVIEHLGTIAQQERFAAECCRVGRHYYIQTPNKWFFFEPHLLTPFVHWLPASARGRVLRYTVWGLLTRPSTQRCADLLAEIRLLTVGDMKRLFPDATVERERFLGWTKAILAYRDR